VSGVGCRVLAVDCRVSMIAVGSFLSGVGCRVLTVDCRVSMIAVGSFLSGVGCQVLAVDCRVSMIAVGSFLSGVGCRVLTVDCRVSMIAVISFLSGVGCVDCRVLVLQLVPCCRMSVVGCRRWHVFAHLFYCRCPALQYCYSYFYWHFVGASLELMFLFR
jgi:hypothetical protein